MGDKKHENNVRKLREAQLMSKAELARKAGLSPLTIDRVEGGKPCRMDTKRKIILALGFKLADRHKVFPEEGEETAAATPVPARRPRREREASAPEDAPAERRTPRGSTTEPDAGSEKPREGSGGRESPSDTPAGEQPDRAKARFS